jgi:hypothetical protein
MSIETKSGKELSLIYDDLHLLSPLCFRGTSGIDCSDGYVVNYTLQQVKVNAGCTGARVNANGAATVTAFQFGTDVQLCVRPTGLGGPALAVANSVINLTDGAGSPLVLPFQYWPKASLFFPCNVIDNGIFATATIEVRLTGQIVIYGNAGNPFANGANCALLTTLCVSYPVENAI